MKSESKLFVLMVCYVVLACIWLAAFPNEVPQSYFLTGLFLGSIFGLSIMATVWSVMGPGHLALRLVSSATVTIVFPHASSLALRSNFLLAVLPCQLAIIVTVMVVTLVFKNWMGVRLQKSNALKPDDDETNTSSQFGIRHLMIVTSAVAILLALGRIALPMFKDVPFEGLLIFGFLAFGTCLCCIPFLLSVLSLKRCFTPTLLLFVLAGVATIGESFLFDTLKMSGPELLHFIWINFFARLPILLASMGLRLAGYRLVRSPLQRQSSADLILDQPSEA